MPSMPSITPTWSFTLNANGGIFSNGDTEVSYSGEPDTRFLELVDVYVSKTGFNFLCWTDDLVGLPNCNEYTVYEASANSPLYAVWEPATPTITFNSTTGTFESDSTTTKSVQIELDGTTALSSIVEIPVKPSYKLAGWSTTETGSVEYLPDATPTITADTALYAVWELRDDIGIVQLYDEIEGYTRVENVTVEVYPNAGGFEMYYLSSDTLENVHGAFSDNTTVKVVKNSLIYLTFEITGVTGGTAITSQLFSATSDMEFIYGTGGTAN